MKSYIYFLKSKARSDSGFVLVTSLLLLVVLTLIGISTMRSTTFEVQISGNDRVTKLNFYQAEATSRAGAQKLFNRDPNLVSKDLLLPDYNPFADDPDNLIDTPDAQHPFDDVKNIDTDNDQTITMDDLLAAGESDMIFGTSDIRAKVVILPSTDASLKLGGSRMYSYGAYGASSLEKGFSVVMVGFKKRF